MFRRALFAAILIAGAGSAQQSFVPLTDDAAPTRSIYGYVLDPQGAPVIGATVAGVRSSEGDDAPYTAITDSRGRFAFDVDDGDRFITLATHDLRYARPSHETMPSIELPVDPAELPLELRVVMPTAFSGTVLDTRGNPLSGASIYLGRAFFELGANERGEPVFQLYESRTGDDGKFILTRLPRAVSWLLIHHPDVAPHSYHEDNFPPDGRFRLTEGGILRGCMIGPEGKHVSGAIAVVHLGDLNGFNRGPLYVGSGEDGSFILSKLTRHDFYYERRKEMHAATLVVNDQRFQEDHYYLYLDEDGALPFVEVTLRPAGSVPAKLERHIGRERAKGAVVAFRTNVPLKQDGRGRYPQVTVEKVSPAEPHYTEYVRFNEAGVAEFLGVPPGDYHATVYASAQAFAPIKFAVDGGRLEFTFETGTASLTGQVIGLSREDAAPELLWHVTQDKAFAARGKVPISSDGTFEASNLPVGLCTLRLHGTTQQLELQSGENSLQMVLPEGEIRGHVRNVALGTEPEVTLREETESLNEGRYYRSEKIQPDGSFVARHMPPGRYTVSTHGRIDGDYLPLAETVELAAGEVARVELRPPDEYGKIQGQVIGLPPLEIGWDSPSVLAHPAEGGWANTRYAEVDAAGRYHFNLLAPGRYGLSLSGSDVPKVWLPDVEVRAGMISTVDLVVPNTRPVSFRFIANAPFSRVAFEVLTAEEEFFPLNLSFGSNPPTTEKTYDVELPYGNYIIRARFGDPPRLHTVPFSVPPGDGALEVHVSFGE